MGGTKEDGERISDRTIAAAVFWPFTEKEKAVIVAGKPPEDT